MCMRTSCPTSSPVAGAPVPELLGALLKVADPGRILLEMGGVTSGNRTTAYLGSARAAASIRSTNRSPRSMQLARKLRFLKLLLAPEKNRPPRERRFPGSEQMFELHGGAGPSGICAFS